MLGGLYNLHGTVHGLNDAVYGVHGTVESMVAVHGLRGVVHALHGAVHNLHGAVQTGMAVYTACRVLYLQVLHSGVHGQNSGVHTLIKMACIAL
jgi:hypothetical protein